MLLDEKVDHGPLVAQASITPDTWPLPYSLLEELLAREGGKLLAEVLPDWVSRKIVPEEQRHEEATYTKPITKADGELDLNDSPARNYAKYLALEHWPGTYFFTAKGKERMRVKITKAALEDGNFVVQRVIPEGKREMDYKNFLKG